MDIKRGIDSGLNTVMMIAFAIPGEQPLGIAAAAVMFLFNLVCPDPPPPPVPVTQQELEDALESMKSALIDAIWKGQADQYVGKMLALNQGFTDKWASMQNIKLDGQRYVLIIPDKTTKSWVDDTWTYFDTEASTGVLTTLRALRNDIENTSFNDPSLTPFQILQRRTLTIGLYGLIGSLAVAYLKGALTWSWGNDLLEAWQYQQYQKDVADWTKHSTAYQQAHPLSAIQAKYPGLDLSPQYVPPTWDSFILESGCAQPKLLKEVQAMLDYCVEVPGDPANGVPAQPGLYTTMSTHQDSLDTAVTAYDVTPAGAMLTLGELTTGLSQGGQRAWTWATTAESYGLTGVSEDAINEFGEAINAWKKVAAQANFKNYTVAAGDTLASIALKEYGDASLASAISDNNQDVLKNAPAAGPVPGTVLKIFAQGVLDDLKLELKGA